MAMKASRVENMAVVIGLQSTGESVTQQSIDEKNEAERGFFLRNISEHADF